jgi:hypothetical protein
LYRAWRALDTGGGDVLGKLQHQPRPRVCCACGVCLGEKEVMDRMADLSIAEGLYERARAKLGKERDAVGALPLFEAADAQCRQVLTPISARVLEVGGYLLQVYMAVCDWGKARECLLVTAMEAAKAGLHPPGSPAPALDLVVLAKLEIALGEDKSGDGEMVAMAARHLGEALGPLSLAHGEWSPLVEELRRLRAVQAGALLFVAGTRGRRVV